MSNSNYLNGQDFVFNFIDDSIVGNSNSVGFTTLQFFISNRPWISRQIINRLF
jgi:hypothetical protein